MKYLCLIYQDEAKLAALPEGEIQSLVDRHLELNEELERSGQLIAAHALEPSSAGVKVRVRNGRPAIVDGPYAETKEAVAGFYFIEARDLNEALQVVASLPSAPLGSVEIRPCKHLRHSGALPT